ncbi:DUF6220 domain-containing protein [Pararhizobium arenae]|uniref:DUF6220 domain-containing protein n=1 Tax=Pararhizobium arenae TaxID=1856850 RepID=UPI0009F94CAE|nr:DUF6220 domain-containing protein [Pararhizobium arenae]
MKAMLSPVRPAPGYFQALALSVPLLIGLQLFLAGLAIFSDGVAWEWHRALGSGIGVVILAMLALAITRPALRHYRLLTTLLFALYCLQFVWLELGEALGSGAIQALHPANALLINIASLFMAERTLGQRG